MATLKDHQQAMVDLLASGSGIPASASRLAHAVHDVLNRLLEEPDFMLSSDMAERLFDDATTPGLNDKALAGDLEACRPKATPAERRVKELENTVKQLRASNAKLRIERDEIRSSYESVMPEFKGLHSELSRLQEQAGCRKPDTEGCALDPKLPGYTPPYFKDVK